MRGPRILLPPEDRDPLRVMFVIGSMPIGGAERLLVELVQGMDAKRFAPSLCCLREPGPLGEMLAEKIPVFSEFTDRSFDVFVLGPLARLMKDQQIDAVVTVGTGGDNMFWGRLAAHMANVPVVCSALHAAATDRTTRVEWVNRLLAPFTDAFIAITDTHRQLLVDQERCPAEKVHVIRHGIDIERFRRRSPDENLQQSLGIWPDRPTIGVVAGLRPEKNLGMFLDAAARVMQYRRDVQFVVVGDGPARAGLIQHVVEQQLADNVHFLGARDDVAEILTFFDIFLLTSNSENCPPAILEAMASEVPVIATQIGSISELVCNDKTGYLIAPEDVEAATERVLHLLNNLKLARRMGVNARTMIMESWTLPSMIKGYEDLLLELYRSKCAQPEKEPPDVSEAIEMLS